MFAYESLYQQQVDLIGRLRGEVEGWLHIDDIRTGRHGDAVVFIGKLATDAETVFARVLEPFRRLGYTPFLRRDDDGADVLVARRGVFESVPLRWGLNALLFALTVGTTVFFGASFAGANPLRALGPALNAGQFGPLLDTLSAGAPFAAGLLLILFVHEMGHYIAARLHGVHVTLPYFIPVPFGLGTLGAFIQLKSPVQNRKALFDVGVAGPLTGFVVAFVLFVIGLLTSSVTPSLAGGGLLGKSLLVSWLVNTIVPHPAGTAIALSPLAVAAWFGLLVTALNLLPLGQLDGGHIAYSVLGKYAQPVAWLAFAGLLYLGATAWSGWYFWAFFTLVTGMRHPQPLNDITPLDGGRKALGIFTLILFLVLVTPKPF